MKTNQTASAAKAATKTDDFNTFNIQYEKEGIVARALVGAGLGWLSDNGNKFHTRESVACDVFESALVERDDRDPNRVRRFVQRSHEANHITPHPASVRGDGGYGEFGNA